MEYVTDAGGQPAYDEENENDLKAFRKSIMDMATDMNAVVKAAKVGVTPTPLAGFQYGVPPFNEWKAFAKANNFTENIAKDIYNNIVNGISDRLYIQVTAGILPSKISKYMQQLQNEQELASLDNYGNPADERSWIQLLTGDAVAAAQTAIARTASARNFNRDLRNSKSLKGLVSLIMAYIFGFYFQLRRGGREWKNAVAALSKVELHNIPLEMDKKKRPDLWPPADRNQLEQDIKIVALARLAGAPVKATVADHKQVDVNLGFSWQKQWLLEVLNKKDDQFFKKAAVSAIAPRDHPRGKVIQTGAGRVARNAPGREVAGAIPLELRYIREHPTPDNLLPLVEKTIRLVRRANGPFYRRN